MDFEKTVALMMSADYKERFTAEYWQLHKRFEGLKTLLNAWDAGTLNFTPTCPRGILEMQARIMADYIAVLEARAKIENVELE